MTQPQERASAVEIRRVRSSDAARLVELLIGGALQPGKEDPSDLDAYLRALSDIESAKHNEVLVAEMNGVIVGTCQVFAVRHFHSRGGLCAEIEAVHVDADHRGSGIGALLLEAAVDMARAWGCYRVQLTSHKVRTDAHPFYRRAGFEPTHEGFKLQLR